MCLLGANGAGKTTTLNCISGLVAATAGRIVFEGEDIGSLRVEDMVGRGIMQVPEGREIFTAMSVEDNLMLGALAPHATGEGNRKELERVYGLFPRLRERAAPVRRHAVGRRAADADDRTRPDGEAEAAHARRAEPRPVADPGEQVFDIIKTIHQSGIAILLVEQNARVALDVSSYGYILENGEINLHGPAAALASNPQVHEAYLGGATP